MTAPIRPYTPEEDAAIVAQWQRGPLQAIAPALGRVPQSLNSRAMTLVRRGVLDYGARWKRPWSTADDDLLLEEWGNVPDKVLAKRMGRTVTALTVRAKRLGVNRKMQFLCCRELARILGVDDHKVLALARAGLLRLRKSSVRAAAAAAWRCEVEDLERFLRRYPEQYDRRRIADEPWRGIARAAYQADAPLTLDQAAAELGVARGTVWRHVRRGWLPGALVRDHGGTGTWYVRRSALATFQPRRTELFSELATARVRFIPRDQAERAS